MITSEIVEHVAKLARLKLSDDEKKLYTEQLGKIIGYFDELKAVDTTGIEPMSHALPVINVMRGRRRRTTARSRTASKNSARARRRVFPSA